MSSTAPNALPGFGPRADGKVDRPAPGRLHFFIVLFVGLLFAAALPHLVSMVFPGDVNNLAHMMELRAAFGGDAAPGIRSMWFAGKPPCGFYGVTDRWTGVHCGWDADVQSFDLSDTELRGTLPDVLADMHHLEHVVLTRTGLSGTLPPGMGAMRKLHTFIAAHNNLSGTVPPELGTAPLAYLVLDANALQGTLPPGLADARRLRFLGLGANAISGSIPVDIAALPRLQTLLLYRNNLTGTLPDRWSAEAMHVSLGHNSLSGTLPEELGDMTNLQKLYLNDNRLSGTIPSSFGLLTHLTELDLSNNQLSGPIPASFRNLKQLRHLCLSGNHFDLATALPPSLRKLSPLSDQCHAWTEAHEEGPDAADDAMREDAIAADPDHGQHVDF